MVLELGTRFDHPQVSNLTIIVTGGCYSNAGGFRTGVPFGEVTGGPQQPRSTCSTLVSVNTGL